jgi:hypothetical protein
MRCFINRILLLAVLIAGCDRQSPSSKPTVLVFSGDTAGWITPCGCTANQSGGLLRRGTYINSLSSRANVNYFDIGGAASGTSDYFKLKFEAILDGEALMHIAAHNLGGPELAMGPEYLREVSTKRNHFPFLSTNAHTASGSFANASLSLNVHGKRIFVVGVVSPRYATPAIQVDDPRESILGSIRNQKFDSLIVLAYLPQEELEALAAALPEADAIIGGPTGQAISPRKIGATLLASATNKGKFLIQLTPGGDAPWSGEVVEMSAAIADDPEQKQNLEGYLSRLVTADFPAAETGVIPSLPASSPVSFRVAGTAACAKCHVADDHAWEISKHTRAGEDLIPRHFQADPSCLQCHTTGFALPGGFISPKRTPEWVGVGCENCHGPSQAHAANPSIRTPFAAMDQCIRCHDEENSPHFDKPTYWARIKHGVKIKPPP